MSLEIDRQGRWILSHAVCRHCGRPSWDQFPTGVVADRYRCVYCGRAQNELGDRGCVLCGQPGVVIQRVWPSDPESEGLNDGNDAWLCTAHEVAGAAVLYRYHAREATA